MIPPICERMAGGGCGISRPFGYAASGCFETTESQQKSAMEQHRTDAYEVAALRLSATNDIGDP